MSTHPGNDVRVAERSEVKFLQANPRNRRTYISIFIQALFTCRFVHHRSQSLHILNKQRAAASAERRRNGSGWRALAYPGGRTLRHGKRQFHAAAVNVRIDYRRNRLAIQQHREVGAVAYQR